MENFAKKYIKNLISLLQDSNIEAIEQIIALLDATEGTVYIIGNGGSAATASHMVNDLGVGLKRRNIKSLHVESLSDNSAVCSALANDIGYENIFYMQLKERIKKEDILIAISCSGNSENIIKAVEYVKEEKATVVGLTGFDGGKLLQLSDINFHVATERGDYGLVEDMHSILNHIIYSYYIELASKQ